MTGRKNQHAAADPLRRKQPRLARAYRIAAYLIFGSTWITGVAWLVFHYFCQRQGPFGVEPHPLEAWWLTAHGAGAFAALWLCGVLWAVHIRAGLRLPRRRTSGIVLIVLLALLIATGYLLYYAGGDRIRAGASLVHWLVGLVLVVPLFVHSLRARTWRENRSLQRDAR